MDSKEALRRILAEAENGELVFSTHAHVILQVRMALDDPEVHIEKAALAVQAEPMLAAKVVGLANSVVFNRSGNTISDVRTAVARLGVTLVRSLSTALILRQFSVTQSAANEALAARLWEHSSHVAAICYVLVRRLGGFSPDIAMFAGIVHEIGNFYLISRADAYPALLDNAAGDNWPAGGEALLAGAVLKALAVPPEIAAAVAALHAGNFNLPPRTLGDILYLANCLTPIANPLRPTSADMERTAVLALSTTVIPGQTLAVVLEESGEELNALATSLRF